MRTTRPSSSIFSRYFFLLGSNSLAGHQAENGRHFCVERGVAMVKSKGGRRAKRRERKIRQKHRTQDSLAHTPGAVDSVVVDRLFSFFLLAGDFLFVFHESREGRQDAPDCLGPERRWS